MKHSPKLWLQEFDLETDDPSYRVLCYACGATQIQCNNKDKAIKAWNTRYDTHKIDSGLWAQEKKLLLAENKKQRELLGECASYISGTRSRPFKDEADNLFEKIKALNNG